MKKLSLSAVLAIILGFLVHLAWPYLFPVGSCGHFRTVDLEAADGVWYSFCADCGCGMPVLTSGVSGGRFWLLLLVVVIVVYFIVKRVQDGKG